MSSPITIGGRLIGCAYPPYVVAEMSGNHNGSLQIAFELIDSAKNAGAPAIKLQTYHPDTITLDCNGPEFQIIDGLWAG